MKLTLQIIQTSALVVIAFGILGIFFQINSIPRVKDKFTDAGSKIPSGAKKSYLNQLLFRIDGGSVGVDTRSITVTGSVDANIRGEVGIDNSIEIKNEYGTMIKTDPQ